MSGGVYRLRRVVLGSVREKLYGDLKLETACLVSDSGYMHLDFES